MAILHLLAVTLHQVRFQVNHTTHTANLHHRVQINRIHSILSSHTVILLLQATILLRHHRVPGNLLQVVTLIAEALSAV